MTDLRSDSSVQVQLAVGEPLVSKGEIGLVILNCPAILMTINKELVPVPGIRLAPRQAMELGMNLIHLAKIAEGVK